VSCAWILSALAGEPEVRSLSQCTGQVSWLPGPDDGTVGLPTCGSGLLYCHPPEKLFESYVAVGSSFTVDVGLRFEDNNANPVLLAGAAYTAVRIRVERAAGGTVGECFNPGAGVVDETGAVRWAISCSDPDPVFLVRATSCPCAPGLSSCGSLTACQMPEVFTIDATAAQIAHCPQDPDPPPCKNCCGVGPAGGSPPPQHKGGRGAAPACLAPDGRNSVAPAASGPGVSLRTYPGGVGAPGTPGAAEWRAELGLYWSHEGMERIVADPLDPDTVYLMTRDGGHIRHTDTAADPDGLYEVVSPSDELDRLYAVTGGWELRTLDGEVQFFDGTTGRWLSLTDRNGNTATAEYLGPNGAISKIAMPNQVEEVFTYHPSGKLGSITLVGKDGTSTKGPWTYTWSGDELTQIDRPDGTSWVFSYHPSLEGHLTEMKLVEGGLSRVVQAWEYNAQGLVTGRWKGEGNLDPDPELGDPPPELWSFSYDDPSEPTVTTAIDPLGDSEIYTYDRDPASSRLRQDAVTSACPANDIDYDYSGSNPMLRSSTTNGKGVETTFTWGAEGQLLSRTEAMGLAGLERTTTWSYDEPGFPSFPTEIERPSTTPGQFRREVLTYEADGDLATRTLEGFEGGAPLSSITTTFSYNARGSVDSSDPPGFGSSDETTWTYDPSPDDFRPATRVDPLVANPTRFSYDAFDRLIATIDPAGTRTETEYDDLDRMTVTRVCQVDLSAPQTTCTSGAAEVLSPPLETVNHYELGTLKRRTLPRGNVLSYEYNGAGYLEAVHRRPNAVTNGERVVYGFDAAGNRTSETQQEWSVAAQGWVTRSVTTFSYANRCELASQTDAGGTTSFAYDANGNLSKVWDANHPLDESGTQQPSTIHLYHALDRLIETRVPIPGGPGCNDNPADATGCSVTRFQYDVQDHLTRVEDAEGNVTLYEYSDRDLLALEKSIVLDEGVGTESALLGTRVSTYNPHGFLATTTEVERGLTVTRTSDELDRLAIVDYPSDPDVVYGYDPSTGRLASITRDGHSIGYSYDGYGRVTQDGELGYDYDANGNRSEITYPSGAIAVYTHDFADRELSLTVTPSGAMPAPVASGAAYLPGGPLEALTLGNASTESRDFDGRYLTRLLRVDAQDTFGWVYSHDPVGNVVEIEEPLGCDWDVVVQGTVTDQHVIEACADLQAGPNLVVEQPAGDLELRAASRITFTAPVTVESGAKLSVIPERLGSSNVYTFAYQDYEYFLTSASGDAWGAYSWTYDAIGNRLSEDDNGLVDPYSYTLNDTGGNTPRLTAVDGRFYSIDVSGNLHQVNASGNVIDFTIDEASRIGSAARTPAAETATFVYDGRSYLRRAERLLGGGPDLAFVEPHYSSAGLLHALTRQDDTASGVEEVSIFYFAGRPVATLTESSPGGTPTAEWIYLHTDHLGTPLLATDASGALIWKGPFTPFGEDPLGTHPSGASGSGVFLRLPGQWVDETWQPATEGADLYYNVHPGMNQGREGIRGWIRCDLSGFDCRPDHCPTSWASSSPTLRPSRCCSSIRSG
jgi:YD repeat-containing protein